MIQKIALLAALTTTKPQFLVWLEINSNSQQENHVENLNLRAQKEFFTRDGRFFALW